MLRGVSVVCSSGIVYEKLLYVVCERNGELKG